MKVLVGSHNPVKIAAVQKAFARYFGEPIDVIARAVDSSVSRQPVNDETFEGAQNRAAALRQINQDESLGAVFMVGIEAGIIRLHERWFAFSAICIMDAEGRTSFGTPPFYELPPSVTQELLNGVELGDVMDRLMGEHNTKQRGGAAAYFTRGVVDRKHLYVEGVTLALAPFVNEGLYFRE